MFRRALRPSISRERRLSSRPLEHRNSPGESPGFANRGGRRLVPDPPNNPRPQRERQRIHDRSVRTQLNAQLPHLPSLLTDHPELRQVQRGLLSGACVEEAVDAAGPESAERLAVCQ